FGRLLVENNTFLDGVLELTLLDGADTLAGDVYPLMGTLSNSGNFSSTNQNGGGNTALFTVAVTDDAVTATAVKSITDLSVLTVNPPSAEASPGQDVTVTWTAKNNAAVTTAVTSWTDSVFVSTSPTFDANAVLLGRVPHSGSLAAGVTYN